MTPNYFRFVRVSETEGAETYAGGYALKFTEDYDGNTDWKMGTNTAPAYSDLEHTDDFDGNTAWKMGTNTAPAYSDLNFTDDFLLDTESGGSWPDETL